MLDFTGDRPHFTFSNLTGIHFANRGDFGRGTRAEDFIGDVKLIPHEGFFHQSVAQILGKGNDRIAGDPFKNSGPIGGIDHPVPNDKEIHPAALRDVTFGVEHDSIIEAGAVRQSLRHNRVDVISGRLSLRRVDIGVQPRQGGDCHPNPFFESFFPQIRAPLPGCNPDFGRIGIHIEA